MSIFKLLYVTVALGIGTYALAGDKPAAKGEYCATSATAHNRSDNVRGNFTFCLDVDDNLTARFLVKVLDATYSEGESWKTVNKKVPYTIEVMLVYQYDDGVSEGVSALAFDEPEPTTIQGEKLPEDLTAGSHTYEIRCTESIPEVSEDVAFLDKSFTFNIEAV